MHRIDEAGHVDNMFARGSLDPIQAPTLFGADWPNAIQEEICKVVEDAQGGDAELDKENTGQLLAAIQAMIARATEAHVTQIGETKEFLVAGAWDTEFYAELSGQTVNRADYAALWALVSVSGNLAADAGDKATNRTKWGRGDGVNTFTFPDMRGIFRRVSKGALVSSVIPSDGAFKANQNAAHTHATDQHSGVGGTYGSEPFEENGAGGGVQTGSTGGDEACPDHTTVYYVIRVK